MPRRQLIRDFTTEEKAALCEDSRTEPCTLDGRKASVSGYRNDFATVRSGDTEVQFAWATVKHILSTHRSFKS